MDKLQQIAMGLGRAGICWCGSCLPCSIYPSHWQDIGRLVYVDLIEWSSSDLWTFMVAAHVFDSPAQAIRWMMSQIDVLGGKRPIDLAGTPEGRERVHQVLLQIEYGVFA